MHVARVKREGHGVIPPSTRLVEIDEAGPGVVLAYVVMTYVVMACAGPMKLWQLWPVQGLCSYGLYRLLLASVSCIHRTSPHIPKARLSARYNSTRHTTHV